MFKSSDPFNIVDAAPYKHDPLADLAAACKKQGIHFGVYYSQSQDWHHPGGYAYGRTGRKNGDHWDKAQDGSFDDYLKTVAIPQVKELLTQYQPDVLWWDTSGPMTHDQAVPLHDLLALRPGIITNNRLGGGFKGDTETPEQRIPATGFPDNRDFEVCMTINGTWGYKSYDTNFKSTQTLLRNLVDIASKGGNYLLNVGPTAEGEIPAPEAQRLEEIGKWLKTNGESIYATGPNPFPAPAPASAPAPAATTSRPRPAPVVWDWRATTAPGKIYIHLLTWPADHMFIVPSLPHPLKSAYLLSDPAHTPLSAPFLASGRYRIQLPPAAPDPLDTVIVLETQ
jgi:alpha-L-fucosidase